MEIKPQIRPKAIRSYVIRSGRMTESQRTAYDQHWDAYGLDLANGIYDLTALFGRESSKILEIGFGMGDSLIDMCAADPDSDFIGVEVHPPGVGRAMNRAADLELTNLRVFLADAKDVLLECLPDGSLARVQIYFPDPWHKKKHHKRRLLQPEFVQLVASKLQPGGLMHMATDWEAYAEQMNEVLKAEPVFANQSEYGEYVERPSWRPETKFERRGARLGHSVWDLLYKKCA